MTVLTPGVDQGGKRGCRSRAKKHDLKVDMTPLVDLGFLLIAFFVITTELDKPASLKLAMPQEGPPMPLKMPYALTVLLDKDNTVFYYHGEWNEALAHKRILATSSSINGLGQVIRDKKKYLNKIEKGGGTELMLLIKAAKEASYASVINALDEALIQDVKKYAVVALSEEENTFLQNR